MHFVNYTTSKDSKFNSIFIRQYGCIDASFSPQAEGFSSATLSMVARLACNHPLIV